MSRGFTGTGIVFAGGQEYFQYSISRFLEKYARDMVFSALDGARNYTSFFISNLGFSLELGLLNSETKIDIGVA